MNAKRLILENRMGQKVRSFAVESGSLNIIRREDSNRIEVVSDLSALDNRGIIYEILETTSVSALSKANLKLMGLGVLRLAGENESLTTPIYLMDKEEDEKQMTLALKRSGMGHAAAVSLLIIMSLAMGYFAKKADEPQLVTIEMPKPEQKEEKQHVQVSEQKIVPQKNKVRVAKKAVPKPKVVVQHHVTPPTHQRKAPQVVRNAPQRDMGRVGALAALGGIKTGAHNAEGLDSNSMKNIRSAGVGHGGGGVGDVGKGGMRGMMPGSGLIAGSAGSGGHAESAGGFGTRGAGGGKAGYGKIALVGGTSGVSFPLDDEAVVQGGLDREQIQAVINRHRGEITYCYEHGLQNAPDLRGRVSIQFVISGSGRVNNASIAQSSLGSNTVEGCMVSHLRSWQFPRPVGNVNVDVLYPFNLTRVAGR